MSRFNRRSLLGASFLGVGAALARWPATAAEDNARNPYPNPIEPWVIDDTSAVADTDSGKLVGYIRGGIRIFMGIPYGEILSTEGRWQRGAKVRPWAGKRSARAPGPVSPQAQPLGGVNSVISGPPEDETLFRDSDAHLFRPAEDCLRLNVWTPGLDGKKRQVLFWCHGGGFNDGDSLMELRLEGHNLARHGDVVVVSVNHRLNAVGFLDLTAYGARYADSANLGMLDIVDALKWVRTNIANFGGDPQRVMVFGQSGGGTKVLSLLGMPEAKGLFHKAVAESPGPQIFPTPEQSQASTAAFLKLVDVSPTNIEALHRLPIDKLMAGALAVMNAEFASRTQYTTAGRVTGWQPTVDGRTMLYSPERPTMPSDVPLVIGATLHETFTAMGYPEYAQMPEVRAREIARVYFGPPGDAIYDDYKRLFPKANPFEISAIARASGRYRTYGVKVAQRRAAQNGAPTYSYWFQWRANTFEGRAMSHHELEIPMVFLNTDAVPPVTGATAEARALSLKMADSWLAFARTGNPNTGALPNWSPVTPTALTSMVFDNECRIDPGSDQAALELCWKSRFPNG